MEDISYKCAVDAQDVEDVRRLFNAYKDWLGLDLTFQGFDKEVNSLPGQYGRPHGAIVLARRASGTAVGCVALRPCSIGVETCEMKRLYVSPDGRRLGMGRRLIEEIVRIAVEAGYRRMCLDTLSHMHGAISLYRQTGFVQIDSYYDTPLRDTMFFAKDLSS